MIDKVKVNYLAGSNQNAAMTGGTIEISLRQPPQGGYYGAVTGGATLYPSYGVNGNEKCTDFGNRECSDFGNSNAPISVTTIHNFR